ncbi:MAG TPA: mycothiol system anti-sigma-R factor [Mycobacteriales bacterium]|nr:mycothiol system anti-sigma-R factor [Mycobacteriales bacterium]HWA67576.1 mycothiol system anti-sigma-R factor [Mycobacteriales bacterium]
MSCGNPHEVDCVEIFHRVDVYLAQDYDETTCIEVRQHLEECRPCLERFDLYEDVKKLVGRCCGGEVASVEFKQRLRAKLAEVEVEVTTRETRLP